MNEISQGSYDLIVHNLAMATRNEREDNEQGMWEIVEEETCLAANKLCEEVISIQQEASKIEPCDIRLPRVPLRKE